MSRVFEFQSAPLAEARGDFRATPSPGGKVRSVSIRSPCRSKGRYRNDLVDGYIVMPSCFNPLPLPKQGEITSVLRIPLPPLESPGFNPLPLPKQGEMEMYQICLRRDRVPGFNPLPLPKQGEICRASAKLTLYKMRQVSIRSPCRSKGRCCR